MTITFGPPLTGRGAPLWLPGSGLARRRLRNGAGARLADAVAGLATRDAMRTPPATLPSWWSVAEFVRHFGGGVDRDELYVLIGPNGRPEGVLNLRALAGVRPRRRATTRLAWARHATSLLRVTPTYPLPELALRLPSRGGVAVVVESGRVDATVSCADIRAVAGRAGTHPSGSTGDATASERQ
ncbi:MAG: hypothetical protein QOE97_1822 [Pseudonocardiales bacterium]|nr:hypothetical protein [Pseudonocardiales bacterium]